MNLFSFLFGAPIKAQRETGKLSGESDEIAALTQYYQQEIAPHTRQFENRRVACLKSLRQRIYASIGMYAMLAVAITLFATRQWSDMMFLVYIAILLPFIWWCSRPVSQFRLAVKTTIFPKIFRYFGHDFIYSQSHSMSLSALKRSKLLPSYDDADFDDYVQGTHKGVEIAINELHLTIDVKRDKRTEKQTVFNGVMVQLSSHKAFSGHTVVVKSRGGLINFLSASFKRLSRVKLEDPRFEQQFDVFSSDQIEARYLLTVVFMERLLQLADCFGGKIQCAFYEDKLLIMLACNKNRFELGSIFQGATFEYEFSQINREMKQLFAMIEVLKLDQYTGL
ncbi:DUF3137 domain-containing protein [Shewanella sp. Scap07]|uniref:DUF3137 domain-containing protein n=1 Tax=Shewanella sp. Scap07 TaxID=2589987 RepID=UPI0015BF3A38|nr:DUF3137 domain-containing protein [Shewanella sp. Scap07]QLE87476.1 DUF3137 domain-containing protein [Shewanella sp. Scap07]